MMTFAIDWMGWLPYEFARVEQVFDFFCQRGFVPQKLTTTADSGNNQFVFMRSLEPGTSATAALNPPNVNRA
jgi:hypothetical protein